MAAHPRLEEIVEHLVKKERATLGGDLEPAPSEGSVWSKVVLGLTCAAICIGGLALLRKHVIGGFLLICLGSSSLVVAAALRDLRKTVSAERAEGAKTLEADRPLEQRLLFLSAHPADEVRIFADRMRAALTVVSGSDRSRLEGYVLGIVERILAVHPTTGTLSPDVRAALQAAIEECDEAVSRVAAEGTGIADAISRGFLTDLGKRPEGSPRSGA